MKNPAHPSTQPMSRVQSFLRDVTLLLGSTMTIMAGASISPSLPQIRLAFHHVPNVDFLVKVLLTIPALFIVIGAPFAGVAVDKWGRIPVVALSTLIYAISGSSGFFINTLTGIIISRAILGLSVAGTMTGFTTLIADYYKEPQLNSMMGLQSAFMGFSGVFFLSLSGILADIGWRFPFLIYLSGIPIILGILVFCREPELRNPRTIKGDAQKNSLNHVRITAIYLLASTSMIIFYLVPVLMPFQLKTLFNASNTLIGLSLGSMSLSFSIISVLYKKIKKSFSFQGINIYGFLFMGAGYFIVSISHTYPIILLGLTISGCGMGLILPNLNVWLVSIIPSHLRGRIIGGLSAFIFIGQFCSPLICQPMLARIDIAGCFFAASISGLIISGVTLITSLLQNSMVNPVSMSSESLD